ncbi:MAG: TrbI/VirB10 family protein [Opitutaceae bacterium]|nr:TrbI/VirB10 family protein [Opitutaceae bacterium]
MKLWPFLKSPAGNVTAFLILALGGGTIIYRNNAEEKARSAQLTKVESAPAGPLHETIQRAGLPFKPAAAARPMASKPEGEKGDAPATGSSRKGPRIEKPHILPISLFSSAAASGEKVELSTTYAPYGRLIPCETVVTLESSKLDTPVIGLVTEDVWHDGRLIIPAGAEVHGRASVDRARERIAISGKWVVVWRDGSPLNGTELVLSGIALDREKDDTTGEFGLRDGSAGLVGTLVKTDNWQEIKLFASTFLAGFASGLQELREQGTAFGGLAQVPVASGRNAALQGTSDVLNAYARQIQETIARDGFFARVPAGKQFYLYVTETVDVARGTRGNVANAEIWRKDHAN